MTTSLTPEEIDLLLPEPPVGYFWRIKPFMKYSDYVSLTIRKRLFGSPVSHQVDYELITPGDAGNIQYKARILLGKLTRPPKKIFKDYK